MILGDANGGCWPNELQALLLKAALFDGDAASQAYRDWHAQGGMDRLDTGSYRLLPLVGHNLERCGVAHQDAGTLRGLHRKAWYENRVLFARLAPTVAMLRQAGIPIIMLKGAPLSLRYYRDVGLRPMRDLDLMVPESSVESAISLLESAEWRRIWPRLYHFGPRDLAFRHALAFRSPDGQEVDLHWHAMYQATFPGADAAFWDSSQPLEFEGMPVRTLCPTDQLLQALVHGPAWNAIPPMRWVADALTVMRGAAIDWERFLRLSAQLRLTLFTRAASHYLADVFQAPIPQAVLLELARQRVSAAERVEHRLSQEPQRIHGFLHTARNTYASYRRGASGRGFPREVVDFTRFACYFLDIERPALIWWRTARWAARRIGLYPWPSRVKGS